MTREITITVGAVSARGELFDTPTADAVWQALPFEASFDFWGNEIYFAIPVSLGLERDARETVEKGDFGYWPTGPAFCIFFGPTPISKSGEIRPAGKVNVFGRIKGAPEVFKKASSHERIRVERS
jgi:hypothetical protein